MIQFVRWATAGSVMLLAGMAGAVAQEEESEEPGVFPVEIYACNYNDGKGPADLDAWSAKWNAWADSSAPEPYSAYTLTPFYYGQDQDFDFLWLGVSPSATELGRAYDNYLANSGSLQPEFEAMVTCSAHSNFATLTVKEPPDENDSTPFVISFSDCNTAEGKTFDDVHPALKAWSDYRTEHGSPAGMWVLWPAYGGGDADFDFKFIISYPDHESQGADYDQYAKGGHEKALELFGGLLDCNESRVYNAIQRRDGIPDDD